MRIKAIAIAIIALLSIALYLSMQNGQMQKRERQRQEQNVVILTEEVRTYKVQDSINVSEKRMLELKSSEFENLYAKEAQKVKMLNKKIKDLESIIETKVEIHDTITNIVVKEIEKGILEFNYSDDFFTVLNGRIINDKLTLNYQADLVIDIMQLRERKRFLGFLWLTNKTKCHKVEVFSLNPKVKISGITAIKID